MTNIRSIRHPIHPLATAVAAIAIAGCQATAPSDAISVRPGAEEPKSTMVAATPIDDRVPHPQFPPRVPASHGPYPAPYLAATAETLPAALAAALRDCDAVALAALTTPSLSLRHAPGGGVDVVGNHDLGRFIADTLCLPAHEPVVLTEPPAALRPVTETLRGAYDPAMAVETVLFAAGRGADRRAEARLVLLRESDGSVRLGAVEYAPAGFDVPADENHNGHRTVRMSLNKAGQSVEIDVPAAWHSEGSGGISGRITSYLPYAYDLSHSRTNEGWGPGQTTMEFYTLEGLRSESIDGFIRSSTYYGEPPTEIQQERFTLLSGEAAVLARFTYSSALSTQLFIETDSGVVGVACEGDQAPCDAILRGARIR